MNLIAILEKWSADNIALQRLLNETLKEKDNGGIVPSHIHALRDALSSKNSDFSVSSREQRRNAVLYILRARRCAGLQGRPELNYEWGFMELLPMIGMTKEELEEIVRKHCANASIEIGGELTDSSLLSMKFHSVCLLCACTCTKITCY